MRYFLWATLALMAIAVIAVLSLDDAPPPAPELDSPLSVADKIAAMGHQTLCEEPTQLRSGRDGEGPTVYHCAD